MMKKIALQIPGANGNPIQINGVGGMPEGGTNALANIVATGLDLLILTALILCLIWFIWGAINWMMSGGDKQKVNQAREKLVYSMIGLGVILLSFLIINAFYWFFLGNARPLMYPK
jgi:TRAP-type C4-dicarboxylate transport system permease small subunit